MARNVLMFIVVALLTGATASAIPAHPGLRTVHQSDGTTLQVGQMGDEFHHCYVTADGKTLGIGADGDYYYYSATGLTTMRAHNADQRSAAEQAFLAAHEGEFTMAATESNVQRARRASARPKRVGSTQVPTLGSPRVPIILVQYTDKAMSNTKAQFNAHYNTDAKSARQYFIDQSNGMYSPQYDVYGIYTLPRNRRYYGGSASNGNDELVATMVGDAIDQAGDDIDWSLYDNDGDGEADVCIVVYAGEGQAQSGTAAAVWPCQWSLSAGQYYSDGSGARVRNSTVIDRFAVFNETYYDQYRGNTTQIDGIGVFCHEFSHCLGLPDFYETTYSNGYYGMGTWSLMNSGSYNGISIDGDTPIGYCAYEKNFMGWIDLITPTDNTQYTLPVFNNKSIEGDVALKITALNDNEYWILENRRKQGWDECIADEGVLISHFTYVADRWSGNTVNNQRVQLATIMPADNNLSRYNESSDLYGESNHAFTSTSSPAMRANMSASGSLSSSTGGAGGVNKPVTDIYLNADGTATLWYVKGNMPSLSAPVLADATGATPTSFIATWTHTSTVNCTYTLQVNRGSEIVFSEAGITDMACTVGGLEFGQIYTFKVKAVPVDASQATESAWSNVKSVILPEEIRPVLSATPAAVGFGDVVVGQSATQTFRLTGANLEGDVTLTLTDADSVFNLSDTTVSMDDATAGKDITITFTPPTNKPYTATVSLESTNAKTQTLTVTANGVHEVPVMQPADEQYVKHTSFRADWTDVTDADYVESYTLEVSYVNPYVAPELLEDADFSNLSAVTSWWSGTLSNVFNNYTQYLPSNWTCTSPLYVSNGAIIIGASVTSKTYNVPEEYDKISVVVSGKSFNSANYGVSELLVSTSGSSQSQSQTMTDNVEEYTYVFDANSTEKLTFTAINYPQVSGIKIYAGEISDPANARLLEVVENGDSTFRVITGITDNHYVVKDLTAGGTFNFKVKAVYANQTESEWSNVEQVTLSETPDETYKVGDINLDGNIDINDLNILINIVLGNDSADNYDGRANILGNATVDVTDINALINIVLSL